MSVSWDKYWKSENLSYWMIPADEVLEFIKICNPKSHQHVLDLGCGLGRHSLAFAEAGFNITASDSSNSALSKLASVSKESNLKINTVLVDYSKKYFPNSSFDIIISYNVIYHGNRDSLSNALRLCYDYLKPDGIMFFTCPTRDDAKYGSGNKVAENTYESLNSVHPGDIHYFADEADVIDLCKGFSSVALEKKEYWWDHDDEKQFSSYWVVKAIK